MRRHGMASLVAAGGIGVAVLIGAPATSSPQGGASAPPAACTSPYLPLYGAQLNTDGSTRLQLWPTYPVTPPDTTGTDLDHIRPRYLAGPDTDGDGRGDQVSIDLGSGEQVLVIERGDGVVRVGLSGSNLGELTSRPLGDLDADGRDEVMFLARPAGPGEDRIFVLPGTTPVGSHQADDVSIQIPTYFLYGAGDQIDGAGDDLVVTDDATPGRSGFVSGAEVMAAGPGGELATFPIAVPLVGNPVGVFDLGDARPAVATVEGGPGGAVVHLWRDGADTAYATTGLAADSFQPGVSMSRAGGTTYLVASTGDRGGGVSFTWDVDDPCRELPTGPAGDGTDAGERPAPPADPLTGSSAYTG